MALFTQTVFPQFTQQFKLKVFRRVNFIGRSRREAEEKKKTGLFQNPITVSISRKRNL